MRLGSLTVVVGMVDTKEFLQEKDITLCPGLEQCTVR